MSDDDPDPGEDPFLWDESAGTDETRDESAGTDESQEPDGADEAEFVWDEPADGSAADPPADPESADGSSGGGTDAPLGGLVDDIRRRRSGGRESEAGAGDPGFPDGESAVDGPVADSSAGERDGVDEDGADRNETDRATDDGAAADPEAGTVDVTDRRSDPDAPLGGLADQIRNRRTERDDDPETDAFTRMEHRELASESVWDSLDDEESDGVADGESAEPDPASAPVEERDERVIPKRTCETCPHFAEPPTVACTHEGTEILELVGVDRHRVVDCPMADDRILDADEG